MSSAPAAKWFDALPTPISTPAQLSAQDLHELLHSSETRAQVLVVDVRRADIEVLDPSCKLCSVDVVRAIKRV